MKTCRRCQNELPESKFKLMSNGKLSPFCNDCIDNTIFAPEPKLHNRERPRRKYRGKIETYNNGTPHPHTSKHGLTIEEQKKLLELQDYKCAVCNRSIYLVLDHCHDSGLARGYVCQACNIKLIGLDASDWLAKATAYLENPPVTSVR